MIIYKIKDKLIYILGIKIWENEKKLSLYKDIIQNS